MRVALFAAGLFAASMGQAATVTIDFDGPVSTDITNSFTGVSFLAPGVDGPVRTWATTEADTPGNVVGLSSPPNNNFALNQIDSTAIDIVFDTLQKGVSIRAAFTQASDSFLGYNGSPAPFMAIYDSDVISAANRIGLVSWNIPGDSCLNSGGAICMSAYDTLVFNSAATDIKAIRITGAAPPMGNLARLGIFDTLTYSTEALPVPEPSSMLLWAVGVVVLAAGRFTHGRRT